MREEEFRTGCEGFCSVRGACYMLGRWLEKNMTPDRCELEQYRVKNIDYCSARIENKPVTDIAWQNKDVRKIIDYTQLTYVMGVAVRCSRNSLELDAPVPKEETEYWEKRVKELAEQIETLYFQPTHEHIVCDHIHLFYRAPSPSGFRKFMRLVQDIRKEKRPEVGEELREHLKT